MTFLYWRTYTLCVFMYDTDVLIYDLLSLTSQYIMEMLTV